MFYIIDIYILLQVFLVKVVTILIYFSTNYSTILYISKSIYLCQH